MKQSRISKVRGVLRGAATMAFVGVLAVSSAFALIACFTALVSVREFLLSLIFGKFDPFVGIFAFLFTLALLALGWSSLTFVRDVWLEYRLHRESGNESAGP